MNLYSAAALIGFGFGLLAAAAIFWGSASVDEALASLDHDEDDDLMAVADAVQADVDEPVPYEPASWPGTDSDEKWLRTIGVEP